MSQKKIILYKNDLPKDLKLQGRSLAIDTETMGLDIKRDRLCLIQIKDESDNIYLVQFQKGQYTAPNLCAYLKDPSWNKIFHFARFDLLAIYNSLGVLCSNIFCTKIASKLSRTYTEKHSLSVLCKDLLNVDLSKKQQLSNWGATELSQEQINYAAEDVLYLHVIKNKMIDLLEQENRVAIANSCFQFLPARVILDYYSWSGDKDIFNH